jgi:hypothetical protein
VRPNGWRLSCGAEREGSQTECYHTACRVSSEPFDDGRRQLQARVRQRLHGARWANIHAIIRAKGHLVGELVQLLVTSVQRIRGVRFDPLNV